MWESIILQWKFGSLRSSRGDVGVFKLCLSGSVGIQVLCSAEDHSAVKFQWFLQELPEEVVMEIFYQYDIDQEDDDGLGFRDLVEKSLVLVNHKTYLVDFTRDRETELAKK